MESSATKLVTLQPMTELDWQAVRAIYLEGIATGNATFEKKAPNWETWDAGLHKRCGFRIVRVRDKLGCMDGRWRDVLLLERRSAIVGV